MPSPSDVAQERLTQALQHQRQLAERETLRQEEINRLREALNEAGHFIAEWEAQTHNELSVTQVKSKYGKAIETDTVSKEIAIVEVNRARGLEHLRVLADKAKSAMRRAGRG